MAEKRDLERPHEERVTVVDTRGDECMYNGGKGGSMYVCSLCMSAPLLIDEIIDWYIY